MDLSTEHQEIIYKIAKENGIENHEIVVETGSNKGDNFLGIITRITIKNDQKKLVLIMKTTTATNVQRNIHSIRQCYLREIYLYQRVFPEFELYQNEYNISNKFNAYPKYYTSISDEMKEMLILEDMRPSDYEMANRKVTMNVAHIETVLKEYAKLHAISIAMKTNHPDKFNDISKDLVDVFQNSMKNTSEADSKIIFESIISNLYKSVKGDLIATEELKKYEKYIATSNRNTDPEDLIVITHGDCWCNNFLFKYLDTDKLTPSQVCIIDWQLSKLGSPGLDICYFLFANASKPILDDFKRYLRLYYDTLSQNLKEFFCDPEEVFPYEFLEEQFYKYSKKMLIFCSFVMRIIISEPDEAPDVSQNMSDVKKMKGMLEFKLSNMDEYYRRLSVIIKFMSENKMF